MAKKISSCRRRERKLETYQVVKKLYCFLRNYPENVRFEKIHGGVVMGYYEQGTEEIILDYRRDIIPTLIHEFLHHLHPKWSESKICSKERQVVSALSITQCKNIIKMLAYCF